MHFVFLINVLILCLCVAMAWVSAFFLSLVFSLSLPGSQFVFKNCNELEQATTEIRIKQIIINSINNGTIIWLWIYNEISVLLRRRHWNITFFIILYMCCCCCNIAAAAAAGGDVVVGFAVAYPSVCLQFIAHSNKNNFPTKYYCSKWVKWLKWLNCWQNVILYMCTCG